MTSPIPGAQREEGTAREGVMPFQKQVRESAVYTERAP